MGVKTTSFGKVELDISEYERFLLDEGSYLYPVMFDPKEGDRRIYLASELIDFFGVAQKQLESLLSQIPEVVLSKEPTVHEFHLLGHGKTGTNSKGMLTGWSGDLPCHTYETVDEDGQPKIELGVLPEEKNHGCSRGVVYKDESRRKGVLAYLRDGASYLVNHAKDAIPISAGVLTTAGIPSATYLLLETFVGRGDYIYHWGHHLNDSIYAAVMLPVIFASLLTGFKVFEVTNEHFRPYDGPDITSD